MHFRPAHMADAQALHQACYPTQPWPRFWDSFERSLRRQTAEHGRHILAVADDEIIGTAQLALYPACAEIADVLICPAWRGRGVGTALIHHLEQLAAEQGWFPLEMGVAADNPRAQALYLRLGYTADRTIRLPAGGHATILRKEHHAL